jgi:hypothetical protein
MCDVADESVGAAGALRTEGVQVNKWPTDTETSMWVHNIQCVIYPHSTATEAEQVARMRKAMDAVAALAP